jgi:ParB family chromosome partitioning protein
MPKGTDTGTRRTALGLGLDALIPLEDSSSSKKQDGDIVFLSMDRLDPNPNQPRRLFNEESLEDLSNSIKEMGVIQPLVVRPRENNRYEIVAGERRWRAAKIAGYSTIPAIVRDVSDSESLEIALIENLQRENLNPLDTAEAYGMLINKYSYTHDALAKRIGKDRSNITNHVRLLNLPDPIKEDLRNDLLSMGHARTLLGVDHLPTQLNLSRQTVRSNLSVRQLEKIVQNYRNKQSKTISDTQKKDPDVTSLERRLSSHCSTKVVIKKTSNNSGKLEIHFHNQEELSRIISLLGYSEDFS